MANVPNIYLELAKDSGRLYEQMENHLIAKIKAGQLEENSLLPSIREMANLLGVAPITVASAYHWLCERGWAEKVPRIGFRVLFKAEYRDEILRKIAQNKQREAELKRLKPVKHAPDHSHWKYMLLEGIPRGSQSLNFTVKTSYREMKQMGNRREYKELIKQHYQRLEEKVSHILMREFNIRISPEHVCFTVGTQHIFNMVARWLFWGKVVLVMCPCSPAALATFRNDGLQVIGLPVFPEKKGPDLAQMETLCQQYQVAALIVDTYQLQTAIGPLEDPVVQQIQQLAEKYHFAILEHQDERELWYGHGSYRSPIRPTPGLNLIQTGYISNLLEPLHYLAFAIGPEPYISNIRQLYQRSSIPSIEMIAKPYIQLLEKEEHLPAQALRLKKTFGTIRKKVARLLQEHLSEYVSFEMPPAGMACWLIAKPGIKIVPAWEALSKAGILLGRQSDYYTPGLEITETALYFGFADLDAKLAETVIKEMALVFQKSQPSHKPHKGKKNT